MFFKKRVELQVDVGQTSLQLILQAFKTVQILVQRGIACAADRPQGAADRFEAGRVVFGGHPRAIEQRHVAQLNAPAINALVSLQTIDEVADPDFQFEIVMAYQADARCRQSARLLEPIAFGRCGEFVVRRFDFARERVDDLRGMDARSPGDFDEAPLKEPACVAKNEECIFSEARGGGGGANRVRHGFRPRVGVPLSRRSRRRETRRQSALI